MDIAAWFKATAFLLGAALNGYALVKHWRDDHWATRTIWILFGTGAGVTAGYGVAYLSVALGTHSLFLVESDVFQKIDWAFAVLAAAYPLFTSGIMVYLRRQEDIEERLIAAQRCRDKLEAIQAHMREVVQSRDTLADLNERRKAEIEQLNKQLDNG